MEILFSKISHQYEDKVLFKEAELKLSSSDFNFLVGKNGSGKTSLSYFLSSLKKIDKLEVEFQKKTYNQKKWLKVKNFKIKYIFQNPNNQLLNQKVQEEIFFQIPNNETNYQKMLSYLKIFNLKEEILTQNSFNLSHGEKKKILIIEFLLSESDCLIFDEPSANLDYQSTHELMNLLKNLVEQENKIILIICHDLNLIENYATKIFAISDHKILELNLSELEKLAYIYSNNWTPFSQEILNKLDLNWTKSDLKLFLKNNKDIVKGNNEI